MALGTAATIALSVLGGQVLGSVIGDKAGGEQSVGTPPEVTKPTPIPVSPTLDPKKNKKAEQDLLRASMGGSVLNREGTILGGGETKLG